ncbi:MAG TPA: CrcB family protein [Bdellovibrionota bacterium]|nr:CrcB family protein [Bdellovibrionota bacterium]
MPTFLWIGGFGVLGVLSRYGIELALARSSSLFPTGTFLINIAGSFLAGWVFGLGPERGWLTPELRSGLLIGFLGGFTTFSAYALQGARLLATSPGLALAYLALSPMAGTLFAWLGMRLSH